MFVGEYFVCVFYVCLYFIEDYQCVEFIVQFMYGGEIVWWWQNYVIFILNWFEDYCSYIIIGFFVFVKSCVYGFDIVKWYMMEVWQ